MSTPVLMAPLEDVMVGDLEDMRHSNGQLVTVRVLALDTISQPARARVARVDNDEILVVPMMDLNNATSTTTRADESGCVASLPSTAESVLDRPLFSALRSGFGRLGHVLRTAFAAGAAQVAEAAQVVEAARPGEGRRSGEKEMKEVNEGEDPHWDLTSSRALLTSVANALRGQVTTAWRRWAPPRFLRVAREEVTDTEAV